MKIKLILPIIVFCLSISILTATAQDKEGLPLMPLPVVSPGETADTDGDGMLDCWEMRYMTVTDPGCPPLNMNVNDANADNDGDGVTNIKERLHMTDPTMASDYFLLENTLLDATGTNLVLRWHSVNGQKHRVYRSTSIEPGAAWDLVYGPVTGTGSTMEYSEPVGDSPVFFKVSLEPRQPDYWPNEFSNGNSDDWILQNHNRLFEMRPKVLVLNFMNSWNNAASMTDSIIYAMRQSSRYRFFKDPNVTRFLKYELAKHVDLRDPPGIKPNDNSTKYPWSTHFEYEQLYNETFAGYYGYVDPNNPSRYLTLGELINLGLVNELWFFAYHLDYGAPYETIELKQYYDQYLNRRDGVYGPAGNGHDYDMPWVGRSFRITFINGQRGIGCCLENFGHAVEGMANYNFCPYYKKYFDNFADFNLNTKWGLPFRSFYSYRYSGADYNVFPNQHTLESHYYGITRTVNNYVAFAGNVHFMPTGRTHYDLTSDYTVMSTIEHAYMRDGADGKDIAEPWNKSKFAAYYSFVNDCMGAWLVFWRQAMPGRNNTCTDDDGNPMPNWWVFLFY